MDKIWRWMKNKTWDSKEVGPDIFDSNMMYKNRRSKRVFSFTIPRANSTSKCQEEKIPLKVCELEKNFWSEDVNWRTSFIELVILISTVFGVVKNYHGYDKKMNKLRGRKSWFVFELQNNGGLDNEVSEERELWEIKQRDGYLLHTGVVSGETRYHCFFTWYFSRSRRWEDRRVQTSFWDAWDKIESWKYDVIRRQLGQKNTRDT